MNPRQISPIPRAWIFSDQELCMIYATLGRIEDTDPKWGDPAFLMRLALGAGLRRGEFARLRADDCTRDGWIHIRQGKGGKDRDVRVIPELVPWLQRRLDSYRVKSSNLLFPPYPGQPDRTSDSRSTISNWWHRILTRCRMESGWKVPRLNLHKARHTYASWEVAMGRLSMFELAANLGHSTTMITETYYRHMVRELVYAVEKRPKWCDVALGPYKERDHRCLHCNRDFHHSYQFCPHCGTQRERGRRFIKISEPNADNSDSSSPACGFGTV